MSEDFEYVRAYYGVPAELGRRVVVGGKPGIIAADRGHYIGVNFDADRPGLVLNCHPTSEVVYGEMGEVRKPSRYQARYARFREYGDGFDTFIQFCRWDAEPERSWNGERVWIRYGGDVSGIEVADGLYAEFRMSVPPENRGWVLVGDAPIVPLPAPPAEGA